MHISAIPVIAGPGYVTIKITDIPQTAESIAVRYVTPVTPDNSVGFAQVQNYKRSAAWKVGQALTIVPGGFPSNVLINIYVQEQTANQTLDVGLPSNAEPVICD